MTSFERTEIIKIVVKTLNHRATTDVPQHQEVAHVTSPFRMYIPQPKIKVMTLGPVSVRNLAVH